jgi:hypothetical protein
MRSPNRKSYPRYPVAYPRITPKLFVNAVVISLSEKVEILLSQGGEKMVGVGKFLYARGGRNRTKSIGEGFNLG